MDYNINFDLSLRKQEFCLVVQGMSENIRLMYQMKKEVNITKLYTKALYNKKSH